MRKNNIPRRVRFVWLMLLAFLFFANVAMAQKSDPCSPQEYKILSPSAVAIRCVDDVAVLGIVGGTGTLVLHGDSNYSASKAGVRISFFKTEKTWLLLILSGTGGPLEAGKKYTVALTTPVGPISVEIDTTENVKISASIVDSERKSFQAISSIGFAASGKKLAFLKRQGNVVQTEGCKISVVDDSHKATTVPGTCSSVAWVISDLPTEDELASVDPGDVGIYDMTFQTAYATSLIPGPLPFLTVFGTSPKVDPKSRFSPKKAPATKDAAEYYMNLNYAAGVGTVPAWVLDGQVSPRLWMYRGFTLGPLAAADVGNNKLSGQTYTNTVNFGLTSQKPFFRQKRLLEEVLLSSGIKYETDRQFDHDNLLATGDLRYNFAGLYRTQSVATLRAYFDAMEKYKAKKDSLGSAGTPYVPQVDDFRPPLMGYALDFHTGIETGGALVDTTVTASSGKATRALPSYSILRLVPQVHGLLELWKFKIDATMTGRYLALTENTVLETAGHTLILTKVQGWKGLGTVTGTYNLDSQGHFALTIAFKDGFAPPTYKRVNAVQAGLLFKY